MRKPSKGLKVAMMKVIDENSTANNVKKIAKGGYKYFWDLTARLSLPQRMLRTLIRRQVQEVKWVFMSNKQITKDVILQLLKRETKLKGLTFEIGGRK